MEKPSSISMRFASKPVRDELARLANSRRTRKLAYPSALDWKPTTVVNPDSPDGLLFTPFDCWDFIVARLRDEIVEIGVITMHDGKQGFVMKIPAQPHGTIYIKLQIGCGCVVGRSFHYSEYR
jgi:hypothetical protein